MTNQVGSQYYFDANALFKYYQDEKGSLRIRRLVACTPNPILVSELTLLECFGVAVKRYRQKLLKKTAVRKMLKHLRKDVCAQIRPFTLILMPDGLFHLAENILLQYALTFDIGSNDALHLAMVKKIPLQPSPLLVHESGNFDTTRATTRDCPYNINFSCRGNPLWLP